jgi:hypothetical protein
MPVGQQDRRCISLAVPSSLTGSQRTWLARLFYHSSIGFGNTFYSVSLVCFLLPN